MADLIEQFVIAATMDAFFRLKAGRAAYREAHPLMHSRFSAILDRLEGKGARAAFDAADAIYDGAF